MTDRPDPARDFKAASDRFQQAIAAAAEKTTEAEAEATLSAAIEDYNRAVDTYNAHAEQYNREHGLTEDDDEAETLRYLVRNGDTATLEAKPSWPDERDGALAELTAELESANANAAEIADQRTAYRKEIMRLRARVRELEREVRQLRAGAPRAWTQDLRSPVGRFENFINATRSYDSDHLGGIMRGGNAEATITLGDLRAVLARLAELEAHPWQVLHADQDERDGDVRAVARLLASADGSITEMFAAHEALEARFADRIAAIERDAETETAVHGLLADLGQRARDTKAGNQ